MEHTHTPHNGLKMRLPYRNKKVTLWVLFAIIVITMFLFKFTELRPNCLFKMDATNDMAPQMIPFEVCMYRVCQSLQSCRETQREREGGELALDQLAVYLHSRPCI